VGIMTKQEALQEARKRWGQNASIQHWPDAPAAPWKPFVVGLRTGRLFSILGEGQTWEEAFEKAERRRHNG
jgi:hypothetical protein